MSLELSSAAEAGVKELLQQLRDSTGDLPDAWKSKARELADTAVVLATDYASGKIDGAQFRIGRDALVLAGRSMAAEVGLDLMGRRKALVDGTVPIIVRMLVSLASGGTLV